MTETTGHVRALSELLDELCRARQAAAESAALLAARRRAFDDEHAELLAEVAADSALVARLEEQARRLALAVYAATGQREPVAGCRVIEEVRLAYDQQRALRWARTHGVCLRLDTGAFERLAAQTADFRAQDLDFVTVARQPQVLIDEAPARARGRAQDS
jgi:hypothetical protein